MNGARRTSCLPTTAATRLVTVRPASAALPAEVLASAARRRFG
jgi:hypothetical protein